jgi:uncharacterized lipoprotein YajG
MLRFLAALACTAVLAGCGTTNVGLKYAPATAPAKVTPATSPVVVGTFTDQRGEPPTWLGAIRGGFGNPLKNLESDKPAAIYVQSAFADGLRARGIDVPAQGAPYQIIGVVRKLDCNQIVRREANVEIELTVVDVKTGQQRFKRSYSASNLEGSIVALNTGVFASVDDLRATLEKTLGDVVDKALDDPALRAALRA